MSREIEAQEDRALAAWRAGQDLFHDLLDFVRRRATKCACGAIALWRWSTPKAWSGFPHDELTCDRCKKPGSVAIAGADVLRRVSK